MTTSYLLDKRELLLLVELNIPKNQLTQASLYGESDDESFSDEIIRLFDGHFFKDLLKKQPQLKPLYQQFIQTVKNTDDLENNADNIFADMFAGKINIENILEPFFNKHNFFKDESRRSTSFDFIFERYPQVLALTHDYITMHNSIDKTINNFYYEMLRHADHRSMNIDRNEILNNLHDKCFQHIKAQHYYQLDIILALKPHDMTLYQHIMDKFEPLMRNDISILQLFESRLQFFDKASKDHYADNKILFNIFEEKESYEYEYQLSKNYVMQAGNVSNSVANDFLLPFHQAISALLTKYFDGESTRNVNAIHYSFKSFQQKEDAKDFCRLISSNIAPLMTESVYRNPHNVVKDKVTEYAERLYFADQLAKELPVTATKKSRNKI